MSTGPARANLVSTSGDLKEQPQEAKNQSKCQASESSSSRTNNCSKGVSAKAAMGEEAVIQDHQARKLQAADSGDPNNFFVGSPKGPESPMTGDESTTTGQHTNEEGSSPLIQPLVLSRDMLMANSGIKKELSEIPENPHEGRFPANGKNLSEVHENLAEILTDAPAETENNVSSGVQLESGDSGDSAIPANEKDAGFAEKGRGSTGSTGSGGISKNSITLAPLNHSPRPASKEGQQPSSTRSAARPTSKEGSKGDPLKPLAKAARPGSKEGSSRESGASTGQQKYKRNNNRSNTYAGGAGKAGTQSAQLSRPGSKEGNNPIRRVASKDSIITKKNRGLKNQGSQESDLEVTEDGKGNKIVLNIKRNMVREDSEDSLSDSKDFTQSKDLNVLMESKALGVGLNDDLSALFGDFESMQSERLQKKNKGGKNRDASSSSSALPPLRKTNGDKTPPSEMSDIDDLPAGMTNSKKDSAAPNRRSKTLSRMGSKENLTLRSSAENLTFGPKDGTQNNLRGSAEGGPSANLVRKQQSYVRQGSRGLDVGGFGNGAGGAVSKTLSRANTFTMSKTLSRNPSKEYIFDGLDRGSGMFSQNALDPLPAPVSLPTIGTPLKDQRIKFKSKKMKDYAAGELETEFMERIKNDDIAYAIQALEIFGEDLLWSEWGGSCVRTSLITAAKKSQMEMCKILIAYGGIRLLNVTDLRGRKAQMFALQNGFDLTEICRMGFSKIDVDFKILRKVDTQARNLIKHIEQQANREGEGIVLDSNSVMASRVMAGGPGASMALGGVDIMEYMGSKDIREYNRRMRSKESQEKIDADLIRDSTIDSGESKKGSPTSDMNVSKGTDAEMRASATNPAERHLKASLENRLMADIKNDDIEGAAAAAERGGKNAENRVLFESVEMKLPSSGELLKISEGTSSGLDASSGPDMNKGPNSKRSANDNSNANDGPHDLKLKTSAEVLENGVDPNGDMRPDTGKTLFTIMSEDA